MILKNINSFDNLIPKKILVSPVEKVVDKTDLRRALAKAYEMKNLPVIASTLPLYLKKHSSPEYRAVVIQALEQFGDVNMVTILYCQHDDPVLSHAAAYWYRSNIKNVAIECITFLK